MSANRPADVLNRVTQDFEQALSLLSLSKAQLSGQTLEQLRRSLRNINDLIVHPEAFPTPQTILVAADAPSA